MEATRVVRTLLCPGRAVCGLCCVGAACVQLHDEVALAGAPEPLELRRVLAAVLGGVIDSDALPETLCITCVGAAATSYSFLQLCQGYRRTLDSVADLVQTGAELPAQLFHPRARSLFLLLEPKEHTVFIDGGDPLIHTKKALKRLKLLIRRKNERENNVAQCSHCGKMFSSKKAIEKHLRSCMRRGSRSAQVKQFRCTFPGCNSKWPKKYLLRMHAVRVHDERKYPCATCDKQFASPLLVERHVKAEHVYRECRVCREGFVGGKELWSHRVREHRDLSTREVYGVESTQEYRRKSTSKDDRSEPFFCMYPGCDKMYNKQSLLHLHSMRAHEEKRYPCATCSKMFGSPALVDEHVRAKHEPRQCRVCGESFAGRKSLWLHERTHAATDDAERKPTQDKPRTQIICDICGQLFPRIGLLRLHLVTKHGFPETEGARRKPPRTKVHACELCAYSSKSKFAVNTHVRKVHLGEEGRHLCLVCGKRFHKGNDFRRHGLTHAQERPERCNLCDKRFVNKAALLYHTRLHTGERPYECAQCGERFLSASRRGAHVRSKHNPRPQCVICKSTYTNSQVLRGHILKQHMNKESSGTKVRAKKTPKKRIVKEEYIVNER